MSSNYPKGPKSDWLSQANRIVSGEVITNENDIPSLLEWLKDMNWPGAVVIAGYLPKFGNALLPSVCQALKESDPIWNFGILNTLSKSMGREFWVHIVPQIEKIASERDLEGSHVEALYILARHDLTNPDEIRRMIESAKNQPGSNPEDYTEVETLLD
jgi:hypothetical protein